MLEGKNACWTWSRASYNSRDYQLIRWTDQIIFETKWTPRVKHESVIHKSTEANCSLSPFGLSTCLRTFLVCVSVCVWSWKNAKAVGWGKKEKKTHTQLPGFGLALLRQLLASRAGNLTKQLKKQNTRSVSPLNIMSRSRNPPFEKETLLTRLQIQI